jgi:hypothetical protein
VLAEVTYQGIPARGCEIVHVDSVYC